MRYMDTTGDARRASSSEVARTSATPASAQDQHRGGSVVERAGRALRNVARRARSFGGGGGKRPRWLRWARIVAIVAVSLFALYLVAANVILRTHLLRGWINKNENKMRVEYSSAWSPYPGHIIARDLSLRYQDSTVQMLIEVEHATLQINMYALTKRVFALSKLEAEGTTFKLRQKVESLEGNEGRVAAFPPIEGFADPPVEKKVKKPPIPDEDYKLWTVELADISASLREVWTMEYRYRGAGSLTGSFHLKPKRQLWIRPSVMITHGGLLSLGDRELVRGIEGSIEAHIDAFDVREREGTEVLRHLSGRIHQHGQLASLGSVGATYFPKGSSVSIDEGTGPLKIDIDLEHGVVQPGSRVTFHTDAAVVKAPPVSLRSDVDFMVEVATDSAPEPHPSIVAEMTIEHGTGSPALDVRGVKLRIDTGNADFAAPFELARLTASVTSARAGDLSGLQELAPEKMTLEGGAVTAAARADYRRGALEGRVDLTLDKARATMEPFAIVSSGKIWTNVVSEDVEKAIAFPGAGVDLRDMGVKLMQGHAEGLWLKARAEKTNIVTSAGSADSDIAIDSGPGDRTMKLFTRIASLPDVAADVTAGTQLAASLHFRVRPKDISLTVQRAKNGALEGRGRIRKRVGPPTGAFLLSVGPVVAGLEIHDSKVSVHPLAGGGWLDEKLQIR